MVYETRKRKQLAAPNSDSPKKKLDTSHAGNDPVYEDDEDSDNVYDIPDKPQGAKKAKGTPSRGSATGAKETEGQSPAASRKGRSYPKAGDPYSSYVALEDDPKFVYLQTKNCQVYKRFLPEHCDACIAKQAKHGSCRFVGVRKFEINYGRRPSKKAPASPDDINYCLIGDQIPLPFGHGEDDMAIVENEMTNGSAPYANIILPLIVPNLIERLKREKWHESIHQAIHSGTPWNASSGGPRPMIRLRRILLKALCDICFTSNFIGAYMCGCCGREVCLGCWEGWKLPLAGQAPAKVDQCTRRRLHNKESFYFTTRAYPEEIEWMLRQMESAQGKFKQMAPLPTEPEIPTTLPVHPGSEGPVYLATPKDDVSNVSLEQFQQLLRRGGVPLVITGLKERFQLPWTEEFFIEHYGDQECLVTDCADGEVTISTVGEFFKTFSQLTGVKSWKLKDWPPHSDFKTEFPKLFEDFERALPFPEYTTRDAPLNLASRFPPDWIRPDLGPKMYNAYPSPDFLPSEGSDPNPVRGTTNIHFDMTDAVNIMAHATGGPSEQTTREQLAKHGYPECGAIWDIFPPSSSDSIRRYLKRGNPTVDDPINRPLFYLDENDLAELGKPENGGVQSYRIYQNPGDAVFIPAGCAHQVRNRRSCVKVAVDFFSAENSGVCTELLEDFRNLAHATSHRGTRLVGRREDVLQPWNCMLFNWKALTGLDYAQFKRDPELDSPLSDLSDSLFEDFRAGIAGSAFDSIFNAPTTEPMEEDDQKEIKKGGSVAAAGEGEDRDPMEDIEMALQLLESPQAETGKHQTSADVGAIKESNASDLMKEDEMETPTGHLQNGADTAAMEVEQHQTEAALHPVSETDNPQISNEANEKNLTSLVTSDINTHKEENGDNTENPATTDPPQESKNETPTHHIL